MSAALPARGARIAVVGGGLAGLAAAVGLSGRGLRVELFEARRRLGGRATSFRDPASGEVVDHCQHVSMGCCTNLADFCRRTGIADQFRRDRVLNFFSPDGRQFSLAGSRWLPAPWHLAASLWKLTYLTRRERFQVARALWRLARLLLVDSDDQPTIGDWLRGQRQSAQAIERFWSVVLVSALGESVERAGLVQARKVFVDGFLSHPRAYEIDVPQVPLGELYGDRLRAWLEDHGVRVHLGQGLQRVEGDALRISGLVLADGRRLLVDGVVLALPWWLVRLVLDDTIAAALPRLDELDRIEASPITGVHLWFDRPITTLPHAVLIGTLSQWVFSRGVRTYRGEAENAGQRRAAGDWGTWPGRTRAPEAHESPAREATTCGHYYQVVISASRQLAGRDRGQVVAKIVSELAGLWPAAREARLLHWRMVTEPSAVFSVRPGIEGLRPPQATPISNLALAGDWTRTGWPATMEGAVRSGYLAAEAILAGLGQPARLLAPDLPRGWFARRLCV